MTFENGFLRPNYLWHLHGYLLSVKGADALLRELPVVGPVDNFVATLIHEGKLEVRAASIPGC